MNKPYDAGNFEDVKQALKKHKLLEDTRETGLRQILSTAEGRAFLWYLLERCGVYQSSFSADALTMAFNEGRRDIGNFILAAIHHVNPVAYLTMTQEAQEDK